MKCSKFLGAAIGALKKSLIRPKLSRVFVPHWFKLSDPLCLVPQNLQRFNELC
jgi:hypothetical protein